MPEDNAKAVEWYLKTANQGGASAQATVGSMYYSGKGVTQNYEKALESMLKIAESRKEEAFEWLRNYANQNDTRVQYALSFDDGLPF